MGNDWSTSRSRGTSVEGLVALIAGAISSSISLVGFGIDSFIEVMSGAALLWRMAVDADAENRERNERRALRNAIRQYVSLSGQIDPRLPMDRAERVVKFKFVHAKIRVLGNKIGPRSTDSRFSQPTRR
jgi:hypothetical protein